MFIFIHLTKDAAANRFTRHEVKNGLLAAIGLSDGLSEMHDHRRKRITPAPTPQALLAQEDANDGQESSATSLPTLVIEGSDSSPSFSLAPYSSPHSSESTHQTDQDSMMTAWIAELDTTLTDTLNTVCFATAAIQ